MRTSNWISFKSSSAGNGCLSGRTLESRRLGRFPRIDRPLPQAAFPCCNSDCSHRAICDECRDRAKPSQPETCTSTDSRHFPPARALLALRLSTIIPSANRPVCSGAATSADGIGLAQRISANNHAPLKFPPQLQKASFMKNCMVF